VANASILLLTDDTAFARIASGCWQARRKAVDVTVLNSKLWRSYDLSVHHLLVIGPVSRAKQHEVLDSLNAGAAVIVCMPLDSRDAEELRARYPRFVQVPHRDDWANTLLLVASEILQRIEAQQFARHSEREAAKSQNLATLGRYMTDMKHNVNNALTSMLGNAELLLLEPGQLSTQSLLQIRTIHSMAMRINDIMARFSTLATEMREAETASQAETDTANTSTAQSREAGLTTR
jgi:C4-dicarboxylate-specific signal transduction histidine kinase